jgi:hypothetical protein
MVLNKLNPCKMIISLLTIPIVILVIIGYCIYRLKIWVTDE